MNYYTLVSVLVIFLPNIFAIQYYTISTESLETKKGSSSLGDISSTAENGGTEEAKMSVNVTLNSVLPSTTIMTVSAKRLANGEYSTVGVPIQKNFCNYIKEDKLLYPGFMKSGNLPGNCPVKKGFYYMKDYIVDASGFPPVLPSGKYRVVLLISNFGKPLFIIEWTGLVHNNS